MYGKVKMSKRQIKEDKFTAFMLNSKQKLQDNWQFYAIGLLAVILIIIAVPYYMSSQEATSVEAATAYSNAINNYAQGNVQGAITELYQVIDDYSGTDVVEKATFMMGKFQLENKNYSEAVNYFEQYAQKYKVNKFKTAASYAGIGAAYENQGQFAQASEYYVKAADVDPENLMSADYLLSAVRTDLLQGNTENARLQLDKMESEYPSTQAYRDAQRLFAESSK